MRAQIGSVTLRWLICADHRITQLYCFATGESSLPSVAEHFVDAEPALQPLGGIHDENDCKGSLPLALCCFSCVGGSEQVPFENWRTNTLGGGIIFRAQSVRGRVCAARPRSGSLGLQPMDWLQVRSPE
jgi:hypothetical protein